MKVLHLEQEGDEKVLVAQDSAIKAKYYLNCQYCIDELKAGSTFFPNHKASPRCQSGGRNHCTCDRCF